MGIGTKVGLFLVRITVGLTFILAALNKIWPGFDFSKFSNGWLKTEGLKGSLTEGAASIRPEFGFYKSLVQDVFIENASIMTYLVVFGALIVGIALVVGLFTRIAAGLGILIAASLFFFTCEAGFFPLAAVQNVAFANLVLCVVILLSGAGLIGGVDGKIRNRV